MPACLSQGVSFDFRHSRCFLCFVGAILSLTDGVRKEQVTYVAGEWNTFNNAIEIIESFYGTPASSLHIFTHLGTDALRPHFRSSNAADP